jgi:lipopolysaccharide transport system ATP-binding protein
LVDEVLAVGDAVFQKKCLGKMEDVAKNEGRTVLFVSHNMGIITQFCQKGIYLNQGRLVEMGDINPVVSQYLNSSVENAPSRQLHSLDHSQSINKSIFFHEIAISNQDGELSTELDVRYPFAIALTYEVRKPVRNVELSVRISTDDGRAVFTTHQSDYSAERVAFRDKGIYHLAIKVPAMFLMPGTYQVTVGAHEPMIQIHDLHENVLSFQINETGTRLAKYQDHKSAGVVIVDLPWLENLTADEAKL